MTADDELTLVRLARDADRIGRTREAAERYKRLTVLQPGNFEYLRAYVFAEANHDRRACVAALTSFMDIQSPGSPATIKALMMRLPYTESLAREANGENTSSSNYAWEPPFIYSMPDAASFLTLAERLHRDLPGKGSLAMLANARFINKSPKTQDCLDELYPLGGDPRLLGAHLSGPWFDDLEDFAGMPTPNVVSLRRPWIHHERCIFIGCDVVYLQNYGIPLARSIKASGTNTHLHVHIFNTSMTMAVSALNILDRILGPALAVTFEHPLHNSAYRELRYYFAPMRIVRMVEICRATELVIMLDADLMIMENLDFVFERLSRAGVIVCRMPGRIPFHNQMNASIFGIDLTRRKSILRRIAGYILKVMATQTTPWCLDQLAIYCVFHQIMTVTPQYIDILACGPGIYDGRFGAQTALWPAKCTLDDPERAQWQIAHKRFAGMVATEPDKV